jgi:heptosyltransferase-2
MSIIKHVRGKLRNAFALLVLGVFQKTLGWYFRLTAKWHPERNFSTPKNILVFELAGIGDTVLGSAFLRELRRLFPDANIALTVRPSVLNLVEECPYINHLLPFDYRFSKSWIQMRAGSLRWWIQAVKFAATHLWPLKVDMVISPRWDSDPIYAVSAILAFASGASRRVGYLPSNHESKTSRVVRRVAELFTEGPLRQSTKHEVEMQLDVLRHLSETPLSSDLEVWLSISDRKIAAKVVNSSRNILVAIAPGAGWKFREWSAANFSAIGKWLQHNYNADILLVGSQADENLCRSIGSELTTTKVRNLAGQLSLREMAAIFECCSLFVGNDSGPLHVAAAAQIPLVGLYGPGLYERFRPWSSQYEAVDLKLACSPCFEQCIFDSPHCMEGIGEELVKAAIDRQLQLKSSSVRS